MKQKIFLLFSLLILFFPQPNYAVETATNYEDQLIEERIKPIGQVSVKGQSTKVEKKTLSAPSTLSGIEIYQKYCITCHASGLAGAPKVHSADWEPRLKKGIDSIVKSAEKGLNAMPAKGTCQECTAEQLKQATEYMVAKS